MAAATVCGTFGVVLSTRANMLRRAEACIVSQGQHFVVSTTNNLWTIDNQQKVGFTFN